jgi:hypothetical protein
MTKFRPDCPRIILPQIPWAGVGLGLRGICARKRSRSWVIGDWGEFRGYLLAGVGAGGGVDVDQWHFSLRGEARCTTRLRISGPLASDWLPALAAAPAGAHSAISDLRLWKSLSFDCAGALAAYWWCNFVPSGCYRLLTGQ